MTPEAQRIAIAEVRGWASCYVDSSGFLTGYPPNETFRDLLPDYPRDLNAMHEAEKVLTRQDQEKFYTELVYACGNVGVSSWSIVHATAAQRAEAFLKTLNLWDDSK